MSESINPVKITLNKLIYLLNKEHRTAEVVGFDSNTINAEHVHIPRSIIYEWNEYLVTVICKFAFKNSRILSVSFPSDSSVRKIEDGAFFLSLIEYLMIPSSLTELEDGWNKCTDFLKKIEVSANNPRYSSTYSNKYIICKSSPEKENYDVLVFAARNIINAYIPESIEIIGQFCFYSCTELQCVDIPKNTKLRIISDNAFYDCKFTSFSLPKSVTYIGKRSFYFCENLSKFEIPSDSKLKTIGKCAFASTKIRSLLFPSQLIELKKNWCWCTRYLMEIKIDPENPRYSTYNNEFVIGKSTLDKEKYDVLVFASRNIEVAYIPDFIEIIGQCSFEQCIYLTDFKISKYSKLRIIEDNALDESSLEKLTIPSGFTEFKKSWCFRLKYLNSIKIMPDNNNFSILNNELIIGKTSSSQNFDVLIFAVRRIVKVKIPDYIKVIAANAFEDCHRLKKIEITENSQLTTIEDFAFKISLINKIRLPKNLNRIGSSAFLGCKNLKKVEIPSDSELQAIDEFAFHQSSLEFFTFPHNIVKIGQYAFSFSGIRSISIPPNVIEIGDNAFSYCKNLQIIELGDNLNNLKIDSEVVSKSDNVLIMIPAKLVCNH